MMGKWSLQPPPYTKYLSKTQNPHLYLVVIHSIRDHSIRDQQLRIHHANSPLWASIKVVSHKTNWIVRGITLVMRLHDSVFP